MTPRTIKSSPRVLAAIPLAALAVVGSLTAASQSGVVPVPTAAAPRPKPASTPTPPPLAPVAVAPTTQDAATAWNGKARTTPAVAVATSDIPAAALAAYQRAAATIDTAAPTCHLDWSFLAAIGKVESNHGSGRLNAQGLAQPAIIGPALTGDHGTALVTDTDGGVYDGDTALDHAVGPMQILPATWASVGVDADGDGKRDPQDINDAALAAAVFLCADGGDLGTPAGQQAAALRYNPAQWYADSVVAIAHAYATSAPVDSFVSAVYVPARTAVPGSIVPLTPVKHRPHHTSGPSTGPATTPTGGPTSAPTSAPTTAPSSPTSSSTPTTTTDPSTPAAPTTPTVATTDQLTTMCAAAIAKAYPDATADVQRQATGTCVQKLTGDTPDQAQAALPDLVAALPQTSPALVPTPTPTADPSATTSADPSATTSPTDAPTPAP